MSQVIFFSADLLFGSRLAGIGEQVNREIRTVANLAQLEDALQESNTASLVLVDLEAPFANPIRLVEAVQGADAKPRLIGYAGHVKAALLQAAQDAGFDDVLTKGQFNEQMRDLLSSE